MPSDPFSTAVLIGGPAASGKTTIARLLARKHGLRWYSIDAHSWGHRARAIDQGLHKADDPAPGSFDRVPMIKADLDQLAAEYPTAGTVVEGALVIPDFAPIPISVWLMPSAAEQHRRLMHRSGAKTIPDGLVEGLRLIADQLAAAPATIIKVDGQTVTDTLVAVETALASALDDLACARTTSDRQRVIRYGNRSLTDQLQVSIDNGWIDAESQATVRTFDCECGLPDCTAAVQLRPPDAIMLIKHPPGAIHADTHSGS